MEPSVRHFWPAADKSKAERGIGGYGSLWKNHRLKLARIDHSVLTKTEIESWRSSSHMLRQQARRFRRGLPKCRRSQQRRKHEHQEPSSHGSQFSPVPGEI